MTLSKYTSKTVSSSNASTTDLMKPASVEFNDFTTNLINPVIETFQHDNNYFMNQHLYQLLRAISGYIFTGRQA